MSAPRQPAGDRFVPFFCASEYRSVADNFIGFPDTAERLAACYRHNMAFEGMALEPKIINHASPQIRALVKGMSAMRPAAEEAHERLDYPDADISPYETGILWCKAHGVPAAGPGTEWQHRLNEADRAGIDRSEVE